MPSSKNVINLNDTNFDTEVISNKDVSLVDFWAPWCGPCRALGPIIDEIADELVGNNIKVCKLNVDECPDIATKYHINAVPALLIFKNGKVMDQIVGLQPKQNIVNKLNSYSK